MTDITVTFDGVALETPGPRKFTETKDSFTCEFECATDDPTVIDAIVAKSGICRANTLLSGKVSVQTTGTLGSLVIGTTTYTNCAIAKEIKRQEVEGAGGLLWRYTVSFTRHTAS